MTSVEAVLRRSFTPDMFDDLLPTGVSLVSWTQADGTWVVVFDDPAETPLTGAQVAGIRDRMESRDDDDQAVRAVLRTARDGHATNLAELNTSYFLGDPLPAPVFPEQTSPTKKHPK